MHPDSRVFLTSRLGTFEFALIKDRQGRGINYMNVVQETNFHPDHVAFIFGSPDHGYYRKNYIGTTSVLFTGSSLTKIA